MYRQKNKTKSARHEDKKVELLEECIRIDADLQAEI
jgi:hypothetical protein